MMDNKLGLTSSAELAHEEKRISKKKLRREYSIFWRLGGLRR